MTRRTIVKPPMAEGENVDGRIVNPLQTLLEVAEEALLWKDALKRKVVQMESDMWRYNEAGVGEQIRGEITLYEKSIERLTRILVMIAKLGIEERLARVTERQALLIEKAVSRALEETGLEAVKQDEVREAVAKHLRAVS
jgi:hypothetical protein